MTGPLHRQFGSVVKKIVRLALPNGPAAPPVATPEPAAADPAVREPEMAVAA